MKKIFSKGIALGLMLFLCVISCIGCGNADKGSSQGLTKVTLNEVAHSIFYAPMYVAIEEGYFAEEGIELELVTGFGADI